MKKYLILILFCLLISTSLFALGRPGPGPWDGENNKKPGPHHGGGGTPEPASILLILAGGAAAYGIKKVIKKK